MSATEPASSFSEHRIAHRLDFDPDRTAVLVIDMLNDFLEPEGAMPLLEGRRLYEPIRRLLNVARQVGSPVIWICDEHLPSDREFEKRSVHCLQGSWGAQIVPDLGPDEEELRIPKTRYSGFFETDLDQRLRELGVDHLILTGVVTNICVRSTAHDAFFRDYRVTIPVECVAATSEREQDSTLYDLDTHYGTVAGLEEVLAILAGAQQAG
ncbi:MAG TPA: isochorismatase family cysteine hydrolase [Acidimicrobiia bacterium]|nr:isochorismatase family cysteine hydrolase [Acidimicrobiia bacterium]